MCTDYLDIKASRGLTLDEAITIAIKRHGIDSKIRRMALKHEGIKGIKFLSETGKIVYLDFDFIPEYRAVNLKGV